MRLGITNRTNGSIYVSRKLQGGRINGKVVIGTEMVRKVAVSELYNDNVNPYLSTKVCRVDAIVFFSCYGHKNTVYLKVVSAFLNATLSN